MLGGRSGLAESGHPSSTSSRRPLTRGQPLALVVSSRIPVVAGQWSLHPSSTGYHLVNSRCTPSDIGLRALYAFRRPRCQTIAGILEIRTKSSAATCTHDTPSARPATVDQGSSQRGPALGRGRGLVESWSAQCSAEDPASGRMPEIGCAHDAASRDAIPAAELSPYLRDAPAPRVNSRRPSDPDARARTLNQAEQPGGSRRRPTRLSQLQAPRAPLTGATLPDWCHRRIPLGPPRPLLNLDRPTTSAGALTALMRCGIAPRPCSGAPGATVRQTRAAPQGDLQLARRAQVPEPPATA